MKGVQLHQEHSLRRSQGRPRELSKPWPGSPGGFAHWRAGLSGSFIGPVNVFTNQRANGECQSPAAAGSLKRLFPHQLLSWIRWPYLWSQGGVAPVSPDVIKSSAQSNLDRQEGPKSQCYKTQWWEIAPCQQLWCDEAAKRHKSKETQEESNSTISKNGHARFTAQFSNNLQ